MTARDNAGGLCHSMPMVPRHAYPLAFALLVAQVSAADAGPIRIKAGGPKQKSQREKVLRSLAQAPLHVCWKGQRPDAVTITLEVGRRGQVIQAAKKSAGPAAQCAAGVLAVHTLAATGNRYRMTVSVETESASGRTIRDALAPHRAKLDDCHRRAGARAGRVTLAFKVRPDGRIIDPLIQSSSVGSAKVEKCLLDTISRTRLGTGVTSKLVSYSLGLAFSEAASSKPSPPAAAAAPALQPKKDGPLAGAEINKVMRRRKADFSTCYTAQLGKNRTLAGRVVLRFTIRDDGTVRNVKVRESTLGSARVERCMVKIGKSLRFPSQPGREPTRVFYPFVFSPR